MTDKSLQDDMLPATENDDQECRERAAGSPEVRRKYQPLHFTPHILFSSWLLGWVFLAPSHFPERWRLLTVERALEGIGFALLVAPIGAALGLFFTAPLVAAVVQLGCSILNVLGYRQVLKVTNPLIEKPIFTKELGFILLGALLAICGLTLLRLSELGYENWIDIDAEQEKSLNEVLISIMLVSYICVGLMIIRKGPMG